MVYLVRKDMPFYVTLSVLGLWRYYPLNHQSKTQFSSILCIWIIMWNIFFPVGPTLLCIFNFINYDYLLITTTLPLGIGITVVSITNIIFAIKHEMWSELFKRATNCTKFGKSVNFDHLKQQGERFITVYFVCTVCGIFLVATYEIFHENTCLSNSGKNEVCGLMFASWLPPGLENSIVVKRLLLLYQLLSGIVNTSFTVIVTLQFQVCCFIEDKSEHLSMMIRQINNSEAPKVQYKKFAFCMEYHLYILNLCELLDKACKITFGHITLSTSMVTAFFLYYGMKGNYKFLFYGFVYILTIWIMCNTGQKMEEAMSRVGNSLYLSNWHDYCIEIKKVIPSVIQRAQRSVGLRAVPVGRLNYVLFTMVVRTTYSYLSLLSGNTLQRA